MNASTRFFMFVSLASLGASASENNGSGCDITRKKSKFYTDTDAYKAEVYVVCSNKATMIVSRVRTIDPATGSSIKESYQGCSIPTTATGHGSMILPELCFVTLKNQWKEQAVKSSLNQIKDKILRRKST